ncbi:N-lysine methyltransferase KMT5A [Latimeria chalumnae]
MNGENIYNGQPKIYTYLSPNKSPAARPPLQEENSTNPPEVKHQGKSAVKNEVQKKEENQTQGDAEECILKSEEPKLDCKSGTDGLDPLESVNTIQREAAKNHTNAVLPPADRANSKAEAQRKLKGKHSARRAVDGKISQNRKVTDYYPIRRSARKSKTELKFEEKKKIDELIINGKEEGMKVDIIDGKGRGVLATRSFQKGEFVVEYHGDLIEITDAKKRETLYAQDPSTGCYMYYFQYLSKTYCVDATKETSRLGRLINHSKTGNCQTKLHDTNGVPHLILVASRDIEAGEELLYDYGDRSKASIEAHPWLKH